MEEGKTVFDGKDYVKAIRKANLALDAKPGDPAATKLTNDAQNEFELAKANEKKNHSPYTTLIRSFDGKDYVKAIRQANLALDAKPGDPAATKLRNDAQKELELAKANEEK